MNYNLINSEHTVPWNRILLKWWRASHLDAILLSGILMIAIFGILVIYSASNQSFSLVFRQLSNLALSFGVMLLCAYLPWDRYRMAAPWLFGIGITMLVAVIAMGSISKGGQRWLGLGWLRFQPSEIMKLAVPMMLAWYLRDQNFPLKLKELAISGMIIGIPALLIAKQPDLGTAILVTITGIFVLILAGVTWKITLIFSVLASAIAPIVWNHMYDYQKMRLLIFLAPESDPFGKGYNIIQSKIAIGSGGLWGKGWLHGTQAHLKFLPEASTDFAFAVLGEEWGWLGCLVLFALFAVVIGRCLFISSRAQNTFARLLSGSLTLSSFSACFVNIGMVTGLLPVVGVPLPLISYGGSSLLIFMAGMGMIMSIQTHRKLVTS